MKLINNVCPLNEATSFHAQLLPVATALGRLQSDNATIANACEWLSLLRADALKPHLMTVMKRFKEAVTDNHFLANLLHLKYKGKQQNIYQKLMKKLHDSCS